MAIGFPQGGNDAVAAAFDGAEIDEQHLIFAVVDDLGEHVAAARQIARSELAFEDRVLQMIAEPAHGLVDLGEAAVVADVVTDEKGVAHVLEEYRAMSRRALRPPARLPGPQCLHALIACRRGTEGQHIHSAAAREAPEM